MEIGVAAKEFKVINDIFFATLLPIEAVFWGKISEIVDESGKIKAIGGGIGWLIGGFNKMEIFRKLVGLFEFENERRAKIGSDGFKGEVGMFK